MLTNDIKKGMRIQLRNSWYATMADNAKGNIRMAEVEGFFTEMGSVYSRDIARVQTPDGFWHSVEYTPAQLKLKKMVGSW